MRIFSWLAFATVICGTAVFTACGDDGGGSSSTSTSTTTTATTTTATTTTTTTTTTATTGGGGEGGHGGSHNMGGGGQGGTGGAPECTTPAECEGVDDECQTRTCTAGVCGMSFTADGTPVASQAPGDCKVVVCDGAGAQKTNTDDADVFDDAKECTVDLCGMGTPVNMPKMVGTACSQDMGKVCSATAECVECNTGADCASGLCQASSCVPASCLDLMQNGGETDVDCGGPDCNACADLKKCLVASDCASEVCTGGVCQAATCSDLVSNGSETDVDCGGPLCPDCAAGLSCGAGSDCQSGICAAGVCAAPSCVDATKNGTETDVDCGGMACPKCATGKTCSASGDCVGGSCVAGVCAPTCTDTLKNGAETDVDCGGPSCPDCALGKTCGVNADCVSGVCSGGVCSQINGCDASNTVDMTGQGSININFGGAVGFAYAPPCVRVSPGTQVTFQGGFAAHPLVGGTFANGMATPDNMSPFMPITSMGTQKTFVLAVPGNYPYYCQFHVFGGMYGAVFVQ